MEATIGEAVTAYVSKVSEATYSKKRQKDAVKNLFLGNPKKIISKIQNPPARKTLYLGVKVFLC